ncbi:hypothetical protein FGRMN_9393 [Fusarium graminum]|nr:hypothetical protein FGRMN_9393 [Fusarium graminum]
MVKIAIAGATSELSREILDKLVDTGRHEITAFVRKTDYEDKSNLAKLLRGVHTVLCFFAVHLDPGSATQKRLIDASIEAVVKRYAPSEWATGVKLAESLDVMSWYSGKIEVAEYLESINSDKTVLEYTRFQPGAFMDYLCHPHKTSKYITTTVLNIDFQKQHAFVIEGTLDDEIVYTSVEDIANVVTRAVDYEGEWPVVGGIRGDATTTRQLLKVGEDLRGKPFEIEWLKMEDIASGVLKTDNYPRIDLPSIPQEHVEAFSKMATIGILTAFHRGVYAVSDEWNQRLPDYKFTNAKDLLKGAWSNSP